MKKRVKSVKPSERGFFNIINAVLMCITMVITVYPIWFAVINSLNYGDELVKGIPSSGRHNLRWQAGVQFWEIRTY